MQKSACTGLISPEVCLSAAACFLLFRGAKIHLPLAQKGKTMQVSSKYTVCSLCSTVDELKTELKKTERFQSWWHSSKLLYHLV